MAVITGIAPHPRRAGRFSVDIAGGPTVVLSLEAIERLGLRAGSDVSALAREIERESAATATYDRAVDMLAARGRSRSDLRRQLLRKGEPPEAVDLALERLAQRGYLDDAGYARSFVRSKLLGGGHGRRRLQQELARKGVGRSTADEAIAEVIAEEDIDQSATIDRIAEKKLRALASLDEPTQKRRLYAFLTRRGYDPDEIRESLDRVTRREG